MSLVHKKNLWFVGFLAITIFLSSNFLVPQAGLAQDNDFDDFEEAHEQVEISDPLEGFNRKIFWFNDKVDSYVLEPISRSYKNNMPTPVRRGIFNFFRNLGTPVYLVSDLIRLDLGRFESHMGRFFINSTFGILGIIDVAKDFELEHVDTDIGSAIGSHGIGPGPYLVLPLLGPSNPRDLIGRVGESFLDPVSIIAASELSETDAIITIGASKTVEFIDLRSRLLDATDYGRENSFDYYTFMKSSYSQHRQGVVKGEKAREENDAFQAKED